MLNGAARLS